MKLKQILQNIEILEATADMEMEVSGISYDSRVTEPGDIFTAIVGYESDGHRFIAAALSKGAAVVLCQNEPEENIPYIKVTDTRLALAIASKNFYGDPAGKMVMIGVTGTNGKTTSTLLIKHMLEVSRGAKVGLIGTTGNMIGSKELETERTTPESYELHKLFRQMLDEGCNYVVMEVSSHSLVLQRVAGIEFQVGIFTNLTQDHLDFHKTMDEYAKAKAMLFAQSKIGIINYDDPYASFMIKNACCPVFTYSIKSNEADLVAKDIKLLPNCVKFCAVTTGVIERISLGIPGRFSVYNALDVIACGMALDISFEETAKAMETARGIKGRVEIVPTDGNYTILIDYAHSPDALENVLKTVRETSNGGRVVAVFGCGGDRDTKKRPIMGKIGTYLSDFAIITSDNPRTEEPEAIISDILQGVTVKKSRYIAITDRVKAIEYAIENHEDGDIIVLAGKGHETYQEVNHVKHHMDEREIVAEILEMRKNR